MSAVSLPYSLTNGTTADASQVQANDAALAAGHNDLETKVAGQLGPANTAVGASGLAAGLFAARSSLSRALSTTLSPIICEVEDIDLSGWYDPTTGRFTPQIAGYFLMRGGMAQSTVAGNTLPNNLMLTFRKNGVLISPNVVGELARAYQPGPVSTGTPVTASKVYPVLFNGSTDYCELVAALGSGTGNAWEASFGGFFIGRA